MLTASANGQILPLQFGTSFDSITTPAVYDSKSFIQNVVFDYYQQIYNNSAILNNCLSNFVFVAHPEGQDMVGSVNLYSSSCSNCDSDSYLKALSPNTNYINNGCGSMICTGLLNYLIQDHTVTFFTNTSTIMPNN